MGMRSILSSRQQWGILGNALKRDPANWREWWKSERF